MPHQVDASPNPLWFCSTMNYVFSKGLPVRAAAGIWWRICCSVMLFLLFSVKSLTAKHFLWAVGQFPHLAKHSLQALEFPAYECVHSKLSNKTYMINLLLANVINGFLHHQRQVSLDPVLTFIYPVHKSTCLFNVFRRLSVLETTAAEISNRTGNPVVPVQIDIRDPSAVSTALDVCEAKFGLPNIIINNAAGNFISVKYQYVYLFLICCI